jgi:hypothetical protein
VQVNNKAAKRAEGAFFLLYQGSEEEPDIEEVPPELLDLLATVPHADFDTVVRSWLAVDTDLQAVNWTFASTYDLLAKLVDFAKQTQPLEGHCYLLTSP